MIKDYIELTKPRLTSLVVFTTALGYVLGAGPSGFPFWHTLLGTWLVAAGAATFNQYMERDRDALMKRTRNRPLPQKRLPPRHAFVFASALSAAGTAELWVFVRPLAAFFAALSVSSYLFLYTPLKSRTTLCTLAGAIPGALPPVIGWAAARGTLDEAAGVLFLILFLWQLPHFLAIAWMFREDYARAGFAMLPVLDAEGSATSRMILLYTAVLIPVSLSPLLLGMTGNSYAWGALILGMGFISMGALTAIHRTSAVARRLLLASVIYLPILLCWMAAARIA